jgi:hypothetical protein
MPFDIEAVTREVEAGAWSLRYRWKRLANEGAADLARLFGSRHEHSVQELDLTGCDIGDDGIAALAQVLARDEKIQTLVLNCNSYADKGMAALSKMLTTNTSLTSLDVSSSRSGEPGIISLADALEGGGGGVGGVGNTTLRELKVTRNAIGFGIGPLGVASLKRVLAGNSSLTSLSLWGSMVGDEGTEQLALGLAANASLTSLDLGWNGISDVGVGHLAKCLETNNSLLSLDLRNNAIDLGGVESLNVVLGRWGATLAGGPEVGNVVLEGVNLGGNPVLKKGNEVWATSTGAVFHTKDILGNVGSSSSSSSSTSKSSGGVNKGPEEDEDGLHGDVDGEDEVGSLSDFLDALQVEVERSSSGGDADREGEDSNNNSQSAIPLNVSEESRMLTPEGDGSKKSGATAAAAAAAAVAAGSTTAADGVWSEDELLARAKELHTQALFAAKHRRAMQLAEKKEATQRALDDLLRHLLPGARKERLERAEALSHELRGESDRSAAEALAIIEAKAEFDRNWARNRAEHMGREVDKLAGAEAKRLWSNMQDDRRLWKDVETRSLFPAI